jgi:hypothetical protein
MSHLLSANDVVSGSASVVNESWQEIHSFRAGLSGAQEQIDRAREQIRASRQLLCRIGALVEPVSGAPLH